MPQIEKIMPDLDSKQKTTPRNKFSEKLEGRSPKVPENKFRRRRKEIYVFLNFDFKNVDFGGEIQLME